MIRFFDIIFSFIGLLVLSPILVILIIIGFFDTGSPIFKQTRMGMNMKPFSLFKFRSMHINTQSVPTHLVSSSSLTRWGSFLRSSKLDELPQLINVLIGDMSFVGPRPNLLTQIDLIQHRSLHGVYLVRPGITGLAQIQKIDMSTPVELAEIDAKMINKLSLSDYFMYIFSTVSGKGFGDRVRN